MARTAKCSPRDPKNLAERSGRVNRGFPAEAAGPRHHADTVIDFEAPFAHGSSLLNATILKQFSFRRWSETLFFSRIFSELLNSYDWKSLRPIPHCSETRAGWYGRSVARS